MAPAPPIAPAPVAPTAAPASLAPPAQAPIPTPLPPTAASPAKVAARRLEPSAHKIPATTTESTGELPASVSEDLRRADAVLDSSPNEAIRLARHALLSGRSPRAFGILTRAHCRLGDLGAAQAMFRSVTGPERGRTGQFCKDAGTPL